MSRPDGHWWARVAPGEDLRPVEVWSDRLGQHVETRGSAGLEQLAIEDLPDGWEWGPRCAPVATRAYPNDGLDPVFLIERRRVLFSYDGARAISDFDDESNPLHPETGETLDDDELLAHGWGLEVWDVHLVAFTREEADAYCERRAYDGPFRSYSVPAHGALVDVLAALTDPETNEEER